jgi:hypothetical protein
MQIWPNRELTKFTSTNARLDAAPDMHKTENRPLTSLNNYLVIVQIACDAFTAHEQPATGFPNC